MHFPFSHQIPLSKFGVPTWPQADTISLCGIFPSFSLHYGCKASNTSCGRASPPKKAIVLLDGITKQGRAASTAPWTAFSGFWGCFQPFLPLHQLMMWAPQTTQNSLKDLRERERTMHPLAPVLWDSMSNFFITKALHPFIHLIDMHW